MKSETETELKPAGPVSRVLRDPSLWSVECLKAMGASLFFEKDAELSEREKSDQLAALMWIHYAETDPDAAEVLVDAGSWRPAVKAFHRSPAALLALREVVPVCAMVRQLVEGIVPDGEQAGE